MGYIQSVFRETSTLPSASWDFCSTSLSPAAISAFPPSRGRVSHWDVLL